MYYTFIKTSKSALTKGGIVIDGVFFVPTSAA